MSQKKNKDEGKPNSKPTKRIEGNQLGQETKANDETLLRTYWNGFPRPSNTSFGNGLRTAPGGIVDLVAFPPAPDLTKSDCNRSLAGEAELFIVLLAINAISSGGVLLLEKIDDDGGEDVAVVPTFQPNI